MEFEVPLKSPLPATLVEELIKKSVYCSTRLKGFEVVDSGAAVRLRVEDESHIVEVKDKVFRFIAGMTRGYRPFEKKTVFQSKADPNYVDHAWEEMLRRRWIFDCGRGLAGLSGPALKLYQYLDDVFTRIARQHFAADEFQFPALISADTLGRCNYFSSFPQAITFVAHLTEDLDLLEEFSAANKQGPLQFPRMEALEKPAYCLSPLVCYHCYRLIENEILMPDELRSFTAVGPCFRYESRNMTSLERLWNFNMREIVFVGSREEVKRQRQRCMDAVGDWLDRIGLKASFETASDPFFTTDFSEKTYFQLLSDLKYEIRLNFTEDKTIAAGSFNLHNDFFGKTFSIRSGPEAAFTSCVGFGLERLVYGFICQKGFDIATWPDEVRAFGQS